jgi:hypothetical protein
MRVHLVFYKKLLELALLDAKLKTNIKLKDNNYKAKKVKNLQRFSC